MDYNNLHELTADFRIKLERHKGNPFIYSYFLQKLAEVEEMLVGGQYKVAIGMYWKMWQDFKAITGRKKNRVTYFYR